MSIRRVAASIAYVVTFVVVMFAGSMIAHPAANTTPAPALTTASVNYEAAMQSQISSISGLRHCVPVAAWPKHHIPAAMILQKADSYTVTSTVWTYPAPAGYWTRALCSK
jgi:glucan biosynthesis protein